VAKAPEQTQPSDREPDVIVDDDVLDVNEFAEIQPYQYSITSFGADFPVDGLVARLKRGDIVIPTFDPEMTEVPNVVGFQRRFIWTRTQMDRFIESLLLGLPVPGIFLAVQPNNMLLVIDGQQRLRTLLDFYEGVTRGKEYRLEGVQTEFRGKRYQDLDQEDRRRLNDSIIHATIVRQDQPSDDQSSIYLIFERLNTGGTALQPQEIRVSLFRGPLVDLLRELNRDESWRLLYGPQSKRLKDQELILRFFAFLYMEKDYARPMKEFLNRYMARNRDLHWQKKEILTKDFVETSRLIAKGVGDRAFRPVGPINAAVLDSMMVGLARRIQRGPVTNLDELKKAFTRIVADQHYRQLIESSTAQEDAVHERIGMAQEAFAAVR
jgi:uncharacterized protein DUF262